jgi:hypothetical protein
VDLHKVKVHKHPNYLVYLEGRNMRVLKLTCTKRENCTCLFIGGKSFAIMKEKNVQFPNSYVDKHHTSKPTHNVF